LGLKGLSLKLFVYIYILQTYMYCSRIGIVCPIPSVTRIFYNWLGIRKRIMLLCDVFNEERKYYINSENMNTFLI